MLARLRRESEISWRVSSSQIRLEVEFDSVENVFKNV